MFSPSAWSLSVCLSVCLAAALAVFTDLCSNPGCPLSPTDASLYLPEPQALPLQKEERGGGFLVPRGLMGRKSFIEQSAGLVLTGGPGATTVSCHPDADPAPWGGDICSGVLQHACHPQPREPGAGGAGTGHV